MFFGGEGRHLSGQVKIIPGEWILRVPRPNGECCQNLVPTLLLLIISITSKIFKQVVHFTKKCSLVGPSMNKYKC